MGAIFSCLDPVLTIAAGLTVKDPFMLPVDKKAVSEFCILLNKLKLKIYQHIYIYMPSCVFGMLQVAEAERLKYGSGDCSDHIALVHAYDGWKSAMDAGNAINYCWKHFLSFSTMQVMHSLRRQFEMLLRQAGFVDPVRDYSNKYSKDFDLLKGIICSGLFPGISSVWVKFASI